MVEEISMIDHHADYIACIYMAISSPQKVTCVNGESVGQVISWVSAKRGNVGQVITRGHAPRRWCHFLHFGMRAS